MRFFLVAFACALILAFGCVQKGGLSPGQTYDPNAVFVLPATSISYHAIYRVDEGGTLKKEVWRVPGKMRYDLSVQGQVALAFFFVDSRAYSCTYLSSSPACYDVTPTLSQSDAIRLVPTDADVADAMQVENIKIGGTDGKCYQMTLPSLGDRKLCFAVGGVMAYDSYAVSKSLQHTEYLTELEIYEPGKEPPASVFSLPTAPVAAPAAPEPPAPILVE